MGQEDGGATPQGTEAAAESIDAEAAKAALSVVAQMKEAGVEDPTSVLELVKKLRPYEKGEKLPSAIEKELKTLRKKVEDEDGQSKSEAERLQQQIADLENKLEETATKGSARVAKAALKAAAAAAGMSYPDDAQRLIDAGAVEFDDDGEVMNADKLVDGLKRSRPALFEQRKPGSADGGRRSASGSEKGESMNDRLRRAAGRT